MGGKVNQIKLFSEKFYKKVIHRKARFCEQLFEIAESLINKGVQRFLKGKKEKLTENCPRGERKNIS